MTGTAKRFRDIRVRFFVLFFTAANLIKRYSIVPLVTVSAGTSYGGVSWEAENAIDGKMLMSPRTCHCCASSTTSVGEGQWLEINYLKPYLIGFVQVLGREDGM